MGLAEDVAILKTRRSELIAAMASQGTGPDYSIDGQQVSRSSNRKALLDELAALNKQITALEGPAVFTTFGSP